MVQRLLIIVIVMTVVGLAIVYQERFFNYVDVYHTQEESNKAENLEDQLSLYEARLNEKPENIELAQDLAELYRYQGNIEKAEALYQRILKAKPNHFELRFNYANLLSQDYKRMNDALKQYRKLLRVNNKDLRLLSQLGNLYKRAAENPKESRKYIKLWLNQWAIYYYRLALKEDPRSLENRFNLGVVYLESDKPLRASRELCNVVTLDETSYEAHYNLGLALAKLKAYDPAFREFQIATRMLSNENRMVEAKILAGQIQSIKNSIAQEKEYSGLSALDPPEELSGCLEPISKS